MLKFICLLSVLLFAATPALRAEKLRIIDAANTSPAGRVLHQTALEQIFSGRDIEIKHQLPTEKLWQKISGKEADILIIDRRFLPEKNIGAAVLPFAAEALCLYIHPGNPTGSLKHSRVLEILTEPRPRWKNNHPGNIDIHRIMLKSNINGANVHRRIFGEKEYAGEIFRVSSIEQMINFLTPAALGFGPFISGKQLEFDLLPVDDIAPVRENIISGKYPLTLQYVLVYRNSPAPGTKYFIDALQSDTCRNRLAEYGCIPLWESKP